MALIFNYFPNRCVFTNGILEKFDVNECVYYLINNPNSIDNIISNLNTFTLEEKIFINLLLIHIYFNNPYDDNIKELIDKVVSSIKTDLLQKYKENDKSIKSNETDNYEDKLLDEIHDNYINLIYPYKISENEPDKLWNELAHMDNDFKTKLINYNFTACILSQYLSESESILDAIFNV